MPSLLQQLVASRAGSDLRSPSGAPVRHHPVTPLGPPRTRAGSPREEAQGSGPWTCGFDSRSAHHEHARTSSPRLGRSDRPPATHPVAPMARPLVGGDRRRPGRSGRRSAIHRRLVRRYERADRTPRHPRRHATVPVHGSARAGHRGAVAGLVGRARHVRDAEPGRPTGRRRSGRRTRREAVRARHVPLPVRRGFACRTPPRIHRHRRLRPVQAHDRPQRAAHDGLRRVRTARRAVRRRDRAAPAITTNENITTYRRQLRRLGLAHDPRRSISTTDPEYYRWTQWIFSQMFNAWFDPDTPAEGGGVGKARPIGELVAEFEIGSRPTPDGRGWHELAASEQRTIIDDHRLAYVSDAPVNWCPGLGTVVANEEVTADGRSGSRQLPGVQAQHAPVDDADHRLRRPADRRSRPARLERRDQDDAAQLDRSEPRGQRPLSVGCRRHHGLHDAARHPVRSVVHGARTRAPVRRLADDARPGRRRRRRTDVRQLGRRTSIVRTSIARRPACGPGRTPRTH